MADYEARVGIDFDVTQATAALQRLQQQISAFQSALSKGSAASAKAASNLQRDLLNNINATGQFAASMTTVSSSAENFTRALENNKLSLGQYFRYAGASTKTFGRFFAGEFDTINKVVRERVKTIQTQFIKMGRDSNGALQAIKIRPLALDLQNYSTQAQMAAQRQAIFNQLLRQGSTNLLNFGKNTQWAGRQLMVGFTIPLSIMGATAVKEFEKIEKQAIRFKRVYGDAFSTSAETDQALKNVKQLADEFTKYGIAVEKTMELAADAAQMGLKNADLMAQVTEATRLAVLGEVEQQEALETSISLTNAFGIAAEDLAEKINFLNAVENETVTAISDLTIAIPKAGPVIKQLGGDVEDLAFFLTAMKEGGINASEGANALKSGLASIINPTQKTTEFLNQFGISIQNIVDSNAGDLKGTVFGIANALDQLDPLARARAIEQLFGKFQFSRISTLFQNIVKEGTQAQKVLNLSRASSEELAILAERELGRVEESPLFRFQKVVEQLQASLAPLGGEFLKAITPIVDFARQFLDNFNNMSDGAKRFAVIATTVIAGIGPIALMTFGLIANGIANLIKLFTNVGGLFSKFGQNTNNLGLQTSYLTQEQLESQAAAISMAQSHATLTQVITSQASAVERLAAAYNLTTAAQRRAAATQGIRLPDTPGSGLRPPAPKKYNRGIISVPGPKGAGDIVPAMLSPGEAVIPARQSQKYAGLIQGMIADNIPGFRVGRNPFASMLSRSRVAVRTKQEDLMSMLSEGKNARYSSAFTTGTGADYLTKYGQPNPKQRLMREKMEAQAFGLGPDTPASARPTYGYARTSPIQAFINRIFGFKGRQYNAVTARQQIGDKDSRTYWTNPKTKEYEPNPKYQTDTLERYGDIDLITKRSVGRRTQVAVTDALMDYNRSNYQSQWTLGTVPMRGRGGDFDAARFHRLSNPFGSYKSDPINYPNSYTSNPKPPYVETYTPGGFGLKEVSKIVTKDRSTAKSLQKLVDQAGLGIRVTPQNAPAVVKLFANMFGTRFEEGTAGVKLPKTSQSFGKEIDQYIKGIKSGQIKIQRPDEVLAATMKDLGKMDRVTATSFFQRLAVNAESITGQNVANQVNNFAQSVLGRKGKVMRYSAKGVGTIQEQLLKAKRADELERAMKRLEAEKKLGLPGQIQIDRAHRLEVGSAGKMFRQGWASEGWNPQTHSENAISNALAGSNATKGFSDIYKRGLQQMFDSGQISQSEFRSISRKIKGNLALSESELGIQAKLLGGLAKENPGFFKKNPALLNDVRRAVAGASVPGALKVGAGQPSKDEARSFQEGLRRAKGAPEGVVKSTTGTKKPSSVKRVGGKPSDTRAVAVAPKETILSQSSTSAIRRGRFARIPGLGIIGRAEGSPDGQQIVEKTDKSGRKFYQDTSSGKRVSKAAFDEQQKANAISQRRQRAPMAGRVAGGAGLAGMGAMMYGMTGGPGADIAGALAMPLMMLPMILPMIMNPIGAVVAGLAAAGGAFLLINNTLNETGKKAREAAENLGVGSDAIQKYAEFAGNVSASELRDRQRASLFNPISIQSGKNEFGANFLASDAGGQLLGTIKSAGGFAASENALLAQLQAAVSGGSLSVTQARSVAYAIAEELGDQTIGMDINAKLTQLFGPNGENLINEPLKVQMAQIQTTEANLEGDFGTFLEATEVTGEEFTALAKKTEESFRNTVNDMGLGWTNTIIDIVGNLNPISWVGKLITGDSGFNVITATGATIAAGMEAAQMSVAATNAYIVKASNAIQNYQSAVDALDVNYDKQIAAAEAAGDEALAQELINRKAKERNALMEKYSAATKAVRDQFEQSDEDQQRTLLGAAGDRIKEKFENDTDSLKIYEAATERLSEIASGADRYELTMLLNADALSLSTFDWIANNLSEGSISRILNLETKLTGKDLGTMTSLLSRFGSDRTQQEFIAKFELAADAGQAQEILGLFTEINNLADTLGGEKGQQLLDFYVDPKNAANAESLKNTILELKEFDGEKLTIDYIQNIEGGDQFAKIIKANQKYFDSLDKNQQITYTQVIATVALGDPAQFMQDAIADAAASGNSLTNIAGPTGDAIRDAQIDSMMRGYANKIAEQRTRVLEALGLTEDGEVPGDGGGGAIKNPLDEIFTGLQRVRNSAVGAKKTLAELINLMKPGTNTSTMFRGTDQKLLFSGYSTDFIEAVMSMDEETRRAFVTINNGVVKVTEGGKALNKAFSEIALGDFQFGLVSGIAAANKQTEALNILTGRNSKIKLETALSEADAMSIVSDSTLAYAIATATTSEEVQKLIDDFNKLQAAQRNLNFQTKEGSAAEFGKLYDKAVGFLEAQKATINAQFEIDTNVDQDIIREAQDEINALNFELDDYQAEIQDIDKQEKEVNKKYDQRIDALDKIQQINSDISRQEKSSLDIASALAQGDIAAAARAMRQKQEEDARLAVERQKEQVEKSREIELARLVSANGRTREQIDAKILEIQDKIFKIEEGRLEPAQERIRLLDVERQKSLDLIDDQIDRWNLLSAQVNEAKLKLTPEELSALEYQAGLIRDLLNNWDSIEDKEAILKIIKKTYGDDDNAAAPVVNEAGSTDSAPAPAPAPTPTPTPEPKPKDDAPAADGATTDPAITDKVEDIVSDAENSLDAFLESGMNVAGFINKADADARAKEAADAAKAKQKADQDASLMAAKAVGVVSADNRLTTSADTADRKINATSGRIVVQNGGNITVLPGTSAFDVAKNSAKAGSIVGKGSSSAGEANVFANLAASTKPKPVKTTKPAVNTTTLEGILAASKPTTASILQGKRLKLAGGGMVKYMANGGIFSSLGSDIVPAMLTPGEFVMRRNSVNKYGTDMMKAINNGTFSGDSVYNYEVNVNVKSDANPDQIARAVMSQIKQIDSQRIRSSRY